MSAVSVFPMCVRAGRGLLRLRGSPAALRCPALADSARAASSDRPAGGLAQAILQERLEQRREQRQSQVS